VSGLQEKPEIQESPESRASQRIELLRSSMRRRTLQQCSQKQAHEASLRGFFFSSGCLACKKSLRFRIALNQGIRGASNCCALQCGVEPFNSALKNKPMKLRFGASFLSAGASLQSRDGAPSPHRGLISRVK